MKRSTLCKALFAVVTTGLLLSPVQAGSVAGFGGSTEITQILNNAELVTQSAQMYDQVQQTIQAVQMQKQQLQNLVAAPTMVWGQAKAELEALNQLVAKGQALGYALGNIDQQFAMKFPGYTGIAQKNNFQGASKSWIQTSLDSLSSALSVAGLQSNQFATEQAAMNSIQNIAATAPGALQASQAGVMVAGQQVQQLQKLRSLFSAQMQAQNAYLSMQTQAIANDQSTQDNHFVKYQGSPPSFSSSGGKK